LAQGADIDTTSETTLTPLHYAAMRGDLDSVRYLVERGANLNSRSPLLGTPIFVAAARRYTEVFLALLHHGSNLSGNNHGLGSVLHCACYGDDHTIVRRMLQRSQSLSHATVHLDTWSLTADKTLVPSQIDKSLSSGNWLKGCRVRCSPLLLASERYHFDLLRSSHEMFQHKYFSDAMWNVAGEKKWVTAGLCHIPAWRQKVPPEPLIHTSGSTYVSSKASTTGSQVSDSSAWSFLEFPPPEHEPTFEAKECSLDPRSSGSTLLMWAAASLNLPLINLLLEASVVADAENQEGRTALYYAASPFENATFGDVEKCFRKLLAGGGIGFGLAEQLLESMVSLGYPSMDPRTLHRWGSTIHYRCINIILQHSSFNGDTICKTLLQLVIFVRRKAPDNSADVLHGSVGA
jgi:hypothetical protein